MESYGSILTVVAVVETFIAPISLERKVEPDTSSFASKFGRAHSHCCECESPHRETFAALKSLQAEPEKRRKRMEERVATTAQLFWQEQRIVVTAGDCRCRKISKRISAPIGMGPPHFLAPLIASTVYIVQS